jgi:hypothetical protein
VASGSSRTGALLNPTSAVKTASAIIRGFVSAKNSKKRQPRSAEGLMAQPILVCLSINWLLTVLAFIALLQLHPNVQIAAFAMHRLSARTSRSALLALATLERGCSAWAIPAQNHQRQTTIEFTCVLTLWLLAGARPNSDWRQSLCSTPRSNGQHIVSALSVCGLPRPQPHFSRRAQVEGVYI